MLGVSNSLDVEIFFEKRTIMLQFIKTLKDRANTSEESGFTLIELMVVLLIIAILMLIAIPTFLGARTKAQNRAAQTDLRNALTAEKTAYTSGSVYQASPTTMKGIEPSLDWVNATPTTTPPNQVDVAVSSTGNTVCMSAQSASGTYYGMIDIATGSSAGTYFASSTTASGVQPATCSSAAIGTPVTGTPGAGIWSSSAF